MRLARRSEVDAADSTDTARLEVPLPSDTRGKFRAESVFE